MLQTVNDYDKGVFTCDLGWVTGISINEGEMRVAFDDGEVTYDFSELDELLPIWGECHKNGKGFDVVLDALRPDGRRKFSRGRGKNRRVSSEDIECGVFPERSKRQSLPLEGLQSIRTKWTDC